MSARRSAAELLGVAAIDADGLLVREDGAYVRYLEVGSVNPLVVDQAEGERISAAFAQLAARLPDRQSLQLYVQGTPARARGRARRRRAIAASRPPAPPRTSASTSAHRRSAGSGSPRSSRSA